MISESLVGLQNMIPLVTDVSHQHGMEVNTTTTKWMIVHKKDVQSVENDCIRINKDENETRQISVCT